MHIICIKISCSDGIITFKRLIISVCRNIKTVYIPYKFTSLQSIGKNAFNNASKADGLSSFSYYNDGRTNNNIKIEYQTIIIPENLTEIGESAFNNCKEAHVIYDGTNKIHCLTSIGNKAFFNEHLRAAQEFEKDSMYQKAYEEREAKKNKLLD